MKMLSLILFIVISLPNNANDDLSINDVLLLLQEQSEITASSHLLQCSEDTNLIPHPLLSCEDSNIHTKNPNGLLSSRLQGRIDKYLDHLGAASLDKKFLSWLDTQISSCKQKNEMGDNIRITKILETAKKEYEKKLLNKSLPTTQDEKNLLLMNNPVFPIQYSYGGVNLGLPGKLSKLEFRALSVRDNNLHEKAKVLSEKIKEMQKYIYHSHPEILPHLTLNLLEFRDQGCNFNAAQIYLIEKGFVDDVIPYRKEDKKLVQRISQNCSSITGSPDFRSMVPPNTYLAFINGERISLSLSNFKYFADEKKAIPLPTDQAVKRLTIKWNHKTGKIMKKSIDETNIQKPFPLNNLLKERGISQSTIDNYQTVIKNRKTTFKELNNQLADFLLAPDLIKKIKNITDEVINLKKEIDKKENEIETQTSQIYGLRPKPKIEDWFDCNKKENILKKQYAEFQVMDNLINSPESKQRHEKIIEKSRKLVSDSINRMKISSKAKEKLNERLNAITFGNLGKNLSNKKQIELVLNQFISTKKELKTKEVFNENDLNLNLARAFDPFALGIGDWSSTVEPNAFYSKKEHSMKMLGPFLLPEASQEYELTLLKVLTHEMGHGIDENLPCLHADKYKIPLEDEKIIKNLELCATPGKYVEDYADNISNDAIGFYIKNSLSTLSNEKKISFINEIVSFYCSPKDIIGDSHSSDKERASRVLSHPYFQSLLKASGINNIPDRSSSCEKIVWTRKE